jgi:hypothetical protein
VVFEANSKSVVCRLPRWCVDAEEEEEEEDGDFAGDLRLLHDDCIVTEVVYES